MCSASRFVLRREVVHADVEPPTARMGGVRQRTRLNVWIVFLALAVIVFGATAWPRDGGNPFRAYVASELVPGAGLGDLQVGETTLGTFLERFGAGLPSALYGDETALEFTFARPGLSFVFVVEGACAAAVQRMHGTGLQALRSPRTFAREYPACSDAPLSQLELRAGSSDAATFWRGSTPSGVRLRMEREAALELLGADRDPRWGSEEALMWRSYASDGLVAWFAPDRAAGADGRWILTRLSVLPV